MKSVRTALAVFTLCVPAFAADGDPVKPVAPVAPAETKVETAKIRTATPESEAAFHNYAKLVAFPPHGVKAYSYSMDALIPQFGESIQINFWFEEGKEPKTEVKLPKMIEDQLAQLPPEMQEQVKKQFSSQMGGQSLERADAKIGEYNLTHKSEGGKTIVTATLFDDKAQFESATYTFNSDGLLEKQVFTMHVDPSNPQAAMMAGVEMEMTFTYAKKGDYWGFDTINTVTPMGDVGLKFTWFDLKDTIPLPKSMEMNSPMMPEPLAINFHDFKIDGKAIAGTEKKAEAPKTEEKPKDAPPAPPAPAPAPSEGGK